MSKQTQRGGGGGCGGGGYSVRISDHSPGIFSNTVNMIPLDCRTEQVSSDMVGKSIYYFLEDTVERRKLKVAEMRRSVTCPQKLKLLVEILLPVMMLDSLPSRSKL